MAKRQFPLIERHGDTVVVTARSTTEAQQAASDALGGDCTVTDVEKVHEGGVGGFFATELVRLTAKPSRLRRMDEELNAVFASAEDLVTSLRSRAPHFADRLIEEWRQEETTRGGRPPAPAPPIEPIMETAARAATVVQATPLSPVATVAPPRAVDTMVERPDPLVGAPAIVNSTPPPPPAPASVRPGGWSQQTLRSLGVPDALVAAANGSRPQSEGEWIVALMTVLASRCRQQVTAPSVLVGPVCANLARQLKMVSVAPDELLETVSSVAIPNASAKAIAAGLNGRQVHLVVGGPWHHLAGLPAGIVSAASPGDLLEAVRVCMAWDAQLGWYWSGERYERIDEFTVVAHIRTLMQLVDAGVVAS